MITWKANLAAGGAVATGGATALASLADIDPRVVIGAGAVAGVIATLIGRGSLRHSPTLAHLDEKTAHQAVRWFVLAPLAHVLWIAGASLAPEHVGRWLLVLVGIAFAEYVVARGLEYQAKINPRTRDGRPALAPASGTNLALLTDTRLGGYRPQPEGREDPGPVMQRILDRAGRGFARVVDWSWVGRPDEAVGIAAHVLVPSGNGRKGAGAKLSGADIEDIAIAAREILGVKIGSNWVHVTKEETAGAYTITVTIIDTMARLYGFRNDTTPASIKDPAPIGHEIDGSVHYEPLTQHWGDTGETRSGKTSLVQTKRAYITRCARGDAQGRGAATLWVGGVEKLYDSVGPWIEPFLGTSLPVPIDWVANGPEDTITMLAVAMRVARWRQKVPHRKRGGFKTLIVEIDEASFFLQIATMTVEYDGEQLNPSQMANQMLKGAGSADVWLHLVSQRGTNDEWGVAGGSINTNLQAQSVFRTGDTDEIGRAFGDYKLGNPQNKGEYLFASAHTAVKRLRAEYIQETDPNKPVLLPEGPTIEDVAWSRRVFAADAELDPGSAHAAGEPYRNRHRTAAELYRYLTGLDPELELDERAEQNRASHGPVEPGAEPPVPAEPAGAGPVPPVPELAGPVPEPASAPEPELVPAGAAAGMPTMAAPAVPGGAPKVSGGSGGRSAAFEETFADANEYLDELLGPAGDATKIDSEDETKINFDKIDLPGAPTVIQLAERRSRTERIAELVERAGPNVLSRAGIVAALQAEGDTGRNLPQMVTNALRPLVEAGTVVRVEDGYLGARWAEEAVTDSDDLGQTNSQTNSHPVGGYPS